MNKLKFVEYIRKPSELTQKNLEELEEVIKEFPYFQNARIILAKGSKIKNAADTPKKIASASVYSTNRALLKKYINDDLIFLRPLKAEESVSKTKKTAPKVQPAPIVEEPEEPTAVEVKPVDTPVAEEPIQEAPKTEITVEFDIPEEKEEKVEQETPETKPEDTTATQTPEKAEVKFDIKQADDSKETDEPAFPVNPTPEEASDLDELINALWKDVEEMKKSKARFLEIEKKIEEDEAVNEAVKKATKKTSSTTPKSASASKSVKPASKSSSTAKKASTSKTTKAAAAKKTTTTKSKGAAKSTSTKKTDSTANEKKEKSSDKPSKKEDKPDRSQEQQEIIDNFIKINPTMPPMAKDLETKLGDLSGDSTEFPYDISSEYLAEIYLEQGRKERALQIYEVLLEKYPEKSVYFADIIKKLKEQS